MSEVYFTTNPEANDLLARDPFSMIVGLTLHQQIPTEKAFDGPYRLQQRLDGPLEATEIAAMDPEALEATFKEKPALHRFPANMAKRVQAVAQHIAAEYGGDTRGLWTDVGTGDQFMDNLLAVPGFGEYKARVAIAVFAKHYGAQPSGYEAHLPDWPSVADIDDPEDLAELKARKKAWKQAG